MSAKEKFHAGVYSFCFPGLGQLFNSRPFVALCFFIPFAILEWQGRAVTAIPFLAFISSLEAFMRYKSRESKVSPGRKYLYSAVAILSFCYWMLLMAPAVISMSISTTDV